MNTDGSSINRNLSHIIFITGGTKSGKSEFAEHLAKKVKKLSYVALSENNIDDKEWQEKINLHQKRRPKDWKLIETTDLLNTLIKEDRPLLIDSIGGFVMENIDKENTEWLMKMNSLILKSLAIINLYYLEKYHHVAKGIIVAAINKPITM